MSDIIQTTVYVDLTNQIDDLTGSARVIATTYAPSSSSERSGILFFLVHGGTYTRRYWDLIVPGYVRDAYSCAFYLANQGHTVVTVDMLGTGESTVEISGNDLKPQMIAQAIAVVMAQLKSQAACEKMQDGPAFSVLVGHSMGAYVSLLSQSLYACGDALILLGDNIGPARDVGLDLEMLLSMVDAQGYISIPRPFLHAFFHGSFPPPPEVIAADDGFSVSIPVHLTKDVLTPGSQISLAARITVPLLLGYAQEDIAAIPLDEATYFPQTSSHSTFFLPASAHCTNFSSMRTNLWEVMNRFACEHSHVRAKWNKHSI